MSAPFDRLTVLHSVNGKHAAKQIRHHPKTGKITNKSYGREKYFRVEERSVSTFAELCGTLAELAGMPFAFVIRGEPLPGINQHHTGGSCTPITATRRPFAKCRAAGSSSMRITSWHQRSPIQSTTLRAPSSM